MAHVIEFESLGNADLIVDAVYEGKDSQLSSDPISRLLPGCGNMGGFRLAGKGLDKQFVALFTTGREKDWPDRIDLNTGQFTYYGDNRTPGELHKTPLGGNRVLRRVFDLLHSSPAQRELIPPFFVFQKYPTQKSARSVQFKGLAVPGYGGLSATEDLVAVWKTSLGQRFQNYRSVFTILDLAVIERAHLLSFIGGMGSRVSDAPASFERWGLKHGGSAPIPE